MLKKLVKLWWHDKFFPLAPSICTNYSSLSGRPDIFWGSGTLKKRSKIWVAKSRVQKKQGHCYSKREQARLPFLILSNNDPVFFCTLIFANHILNLFFLGRKLTHVVITRIVGADWLGKWVWPNRFSLL